MLPSLGFQEIVLLGILALVVVGPKDLPLLLRKIGRWMARLRGMANEFRSGFDELARQAELDELRKEVDAMRRHSSFSDMGRDFESSTYADPAPQDVIPHDAAYSGQAALPAPEVQPEPERLADSAFQDNASLPLEGGEVGEGVKQDARSAPNTEQNTSAPADHFTPPPAPSPSRGGEDAVPESVGSTPMRSVS